MRESLLLILLGAGIALSVVGIGTYFSGMDPWSDEKLTFGVLVGGFGIVVIIGSICAGSICALCNALRT